MVYQRKNSSALSQVSEAVSWEECSALDTYNILLHLSISILLFYNWPFFLSYLSRSRLLRALSDHRFAVTSSPIRVRVYSRELPLVIFGHRTITSTHLIQESVHVLPRAKGTLRSGVREDTRGYASASTFVIGSPPLTSFSASRTAFCAHRLHG